tara:strand:+ start:1030 stop:1197 length:168 start_codon:yes stop_codon:yes gene_type:complete
MSETTGFDNLSQDMIDALAFMLGYIDHSQWDDALIAEEESGVRRAILELKRRFGL